MLAAKKAEFREEIRKRQIKKIVSMRRVQIRRLQHIVENKQKKHQFLQQIQNLLYNIRNNNDDLFQLLQNLVTLKNAILKLTLDLIPTIIKSPQHNIVQTLAEILNKIHSGMELDNYRKLPIFQAAIASIAFLVSHFQQFQPEFILQTGIVEIIVPYLNSLQLKKIIIVQNVFKFLAHAVKYSKKMANQYTRLHVPHICIGLYISIQAPPNSILADSFLFLLRNYFEQVDSLENLSPTEISMLLNINRAIFEWNQKQQKKSSMQILGDSLRIVKLLLDLLGKNMNEQEAGQLLKINLQNIDYEKILDVIPVRNYPIEVKKQALLVLDLLVFFDNDDLTETLVIKHDMIVKICTLQQQLKYIEYNILANVATQKYLHERLTQPLRNFFMQLNNKSQNLVQIYTFMVNYLHACSGINQMVQFILNRINQIGQKGQNDHILNQLEAKIYWVLYNKGIYIQVPLRVLALKNQGDLFDALRELVRKVQRYIP